MADVYTMMVQAINYRLQQQYNGFFLVCFFFYSSHIKKIYLCSCELFLSTQILTFPTCNSKIHFDSCWISQFVELGFDSQGVR